MIQLFISNLMFVQLVITNHGQLIQSLFNDLDSDTALLYTQLGETTIKDSLGRIGKNK